MSPGGGFVGLGLPGGSGLPRRGGGKGRGFVLLVVERFGSARSETQIEVEVGIHGLRLKFSTFCNFWIKGNEIRCVP